jgi:antitoxin HigA-1
MFENFVWRGIPMTRQVPYPHPGEILAEEFLKPMQMTPYRLAKEIHVPLTRITAILAGQRAVTVDTALRLSRFFGMSDGFWSGLQIDYDTAIAKDALAKELSAIAMYNERIALAA